MKHFVFVILALECCIALLAADYSTDTITITSEALGEERVILIYTPLDLDNADSVQIVYMPDGEFSESRFQSLINTQNFGSLVGVGIMNRDRRKELLYAYNADQFLEFVAIELIPAVERNYILKDRIIYGHSFGGSFALYSMLHYPGLFEKYIVSSPTPIMDLVATELYLNLNEKLEKQIKVFFSYGSKDMKQVKKWSERLHTNLLEISLDQIIWKFAVFDDENHSTSDVISLVNGLGY